VLTPHPQEKLETYRSKLPSRPNLLLSNRGPVQPWLLRSTAVIHRSCTTAIEVTMAGGVAISPQWITPAAFYPLPEAVSLPVHNYAELAGTLAAHFESSARERLPGLERVRGAIEQELHTQDGRAHKRVANAVLGSLEACGRVDRSRCSRYLHELPARFTLSRKKLPGELRKALGLAPRFSWRKLTTKAPPPFDENYRVESVRSLLNSISVATGLHDVKPVSLQLANDSGRYLHRGFRGRALVLSC